MQETKINEGKLFSVSNKSPVQTEMSLYDVEISLYTDTKMLDYVKRLIVPTGDEANSTVSFEVLSYTKVPGVKILFEGSLYSLEIDKNGFSLFNKSLNGRESLGSREVIRKSRSLVPNKLVSKKSEGRVRVLKSRGTDDISPQKTIVTGKSFFPFQTQSGLFENDASTTSSSSLPSVSYYGGPVISSVQIHPIFWTFNIQCSSQIQPFYSAVCFFAKNGKEEN